MVVACLAIGADVFVSTDPEQVNRLVRRAVKAVEHRDVERLQDLVAQGYRDSFHQSKEQLIQHARAALAASPLARIRILGRSMGQVQGGRAVLTVSVMAIFEPNAVVAQNYKQAVIAEAQLAAGKGGDGRWQLGSVELRKVDNSPATWAQVGRL